MSLPLQHITHTRLDALPINTELSLPIALMSVAFYQQYKMERETEQFKQCLNL